ncbi:MAG: hypothetical protein WD312_01395 [Candidatus Paceibacterota bacterium]
MTDNSKNRYIQETSENTALTNTPSDSSFVSLYKKTEKIATAIYLVTDLLDHEEPLHWSLRENVTYLLNLLVSLRDTVDTRSNTKNACRNKLIDLITQINVATSAGLISQMNGSVLVRELNTLADRIDQLSIDSVGGPHLDDAFFKSSDSENVASAPDQGRRHASVNKPALKSEPLNGGSALASSQASKQGVDNPQIQGGNTDSASSEVTRSKGTKPAVQAKKNKRQRAILHLIKEKGEVSVRDVATVIADCSEKTLQRELMALVDEGVLQKSGKRRWTRYSFA